MRMRVGRFGWAWIDEKTFGFRLKGFLLPEVSWDMLLPEIMKKEGLGRVIISERLYSNIGVSTLIKFPCS